MMKFKKKVACIFKHSIGGCVCVEIHWKLYKSERKMGSVYGGWDDFVR